MLVETGCSKKWLCATFGYYSGLVCNIWVEWIGVLAPKGGCAADAGIVEVTFVRGVYSIFVRVW